MPIYEYKCSVCGNLTREERAMTEDRTVPASCLEPFCDGANLKQFGFAPSFKGNGFYINDKKEKK